MATMRAMQVSKAGGDFELVEREVPQPGFGEALVRVHACGVCHSDSFAKDGGYPGVSHPFVPGHEVAGVIDSLGEGIKGWEPNRRIANWRTANRRIANRRIAYRRTAGPSRRSAWAA